MSCPSESQLQEFLGEALPEVTKAKFAEHIDGCPSCQKALTRFLEAAGDYHDAAASSTVAATTAFLQNLKDRPPPLKSDGPAATPAPVRFPGPPTEAGPLGQLENYHIRELLGSGSFGYVYKAWDQTLRQTVALKILKPEYVPDPTQRARFEREGRKAAAVRHENIVAIYRFATCPDFAPPFLVMEFIDGESLQARLNRQGAVEPAEAARIAREVALGLAAAHAEGVVHRDIKPSNIMLEKGTGRVKITDFGLARGIEASVNVSHSRDIAGTPAYMSPEQILTPQQIDGRSDVFSLGSVLYQLLTGSAPFHGNVLTILEQVKNDDPITPRRLNRRIPPDLETITLKCLAKEPNRRYRSAAEVAEELRRWSVGEPILARPTGRLERVWRWARRNPALASATGVALLSTLVVLVGAIVFAVQQSHAAKRTEDALTEAQTQLRLAARLALAQGIASCEQGDVSRGLLWFSRSLELAPAEDADLQESVRRQLAAWRVQAPILKATWRLDARIAAAAFSPDQETLVIAGADKTLQRYDALTARPRGQAVFTAGVVERFFFHPSGKTFLTWSAVKDAKFQTSAMVAELWNANDGAKLPFIQAKDAGKLLAVAFRTEQKPVLAQSVKDAISVWDGADDFRIDSRGSTIVSISPDGKSLVHGYDGAVDCWDLATKKHERYLPHGGIVAQAIFSPDGQTIFTACDDGRIRLWNRATGSKLFEEIHHNVSALAFSPDGQFLLSATAAGRTAVLWQAEPTGQIAIMHHPREISAIGFSADGKTISTQTRDGAFRRWDAATGQLVGLPFQGTPRAVHPMLTRLLTDRADGQCWLWAPAAFPTPERLDLPRKMRAAAFTADGAALRMVDHEAALWTLDLQARKASGPHAVFAGKPRAVLVSRDASFLLRTGSDVELVPLADDGKPGAVRVHLKAHSPALLQAARTLTASADRQYVAVGVSGPSDVTLVFNAITGEQLHAINHVFPVEALAPHPVEAQIVIGTRDGAERWDLVSGNAIGKRLPHDQAATTLAIGRSGRSLVTGCADKSARIWDAERGITLGEPLVFAERVNAVALSPDDRWAAAWDNGGTLRIWDVASHKPLGGVFRFPIATSNATVAFHPREPLLLTVEADGVRLLRIPEPLTDPSQRIRLQVQVRTGMDMDDNGLLTALPATAWQALRNDLANEIN